MPQMNQKNMQINGAAMDLGVGASTTLAEQMQAKMEEIKKKQKDGKADQFQTGGAASALLTPTFAGGGMNGG